MSISKEKVLQKALEHGHRGKKLKSQLHKAGFKYRGNNMYLREGKRGDLYHINAYTSKNNPKANPKGWETYDKNGVISVDTHHLHNEGMSKQQRRKDAIRQLKGK